jgi:16S rRNA processing protein RimM
MNGPPAAPLEVGRVLGPHGLSGQLKLQLFNPGSPLWTHGERVYLSGAGKPGIWLELMAVSIRGGQALATFNGIESLAAAGALKGSMLFADRGHLAEAAPEEIFLTDLLGFRLLDSTGRDLGCLGEVTQAGKLEFFMVEGPFDILLPTETEFASVDLAKRVATLGFELEPDFQRTKEAQGASESA